ncbi:MAG TPA: erythromycin esterase family protein [Terriglobales bacterium]|nr:erythromycin esterase family protein [Terriglobales bacterium]
MFGIRAGCLLVGLLASPVLMGQVGAPITSSPALSPAPKQVTDWIRSKAIPLNSTNPESALDDLRPLQRVIGDAQIVAMGEATHGTREFFQLKHRMLEFLVEKMGFTVFAIEGNWPESLAVNDYVLNGNGDPAEALAGMYFWSGDTQEMLDMIRWMRRYNENPAHTRKLKFLGFDMQTARVAVANVERYLQKVDPEEAKVAAKVLAALGDVLREKEYSRRPKMLRYQTAFGIKVLLEEFNERKMSYIKSSSEHEWVLAQHNLEIVRQAEQIQSSRQLGRLRLRDARLAQNIKWIVDNEPPGTKIMIWAHNGHVSTDGFPGAASMGVYLRRIYGPRMVVCGFSFDRGSFEAIGRAGPQEFTVGPALPDSLDSALAATGLPLFAVDLREAPSAGTVAEWFDTPHRVRMIGAVYNAALPEMFYVNFLPHSFDVIFFVNQTTAPRTSPKTMEFESRPSQ